MSMKKNIDIMKEDIINKFSNLVKEMDEEKLLDFIDKFEDSDIMELPDSVLNCKKCKMLYGKCEIMLSIEDDAAYICKDRFTEYCNKIQEEN